MADPVLSAFRDLELDPRDEARSRAFGAALDVAAGKTIDMLPAPAATELREFLREFVKSARMRWDDALVVRVLDEWLLRESDPSVRLQLLTDRAIVTEAASFDETRVIEAWQAVLAMAKKVGDSLAVARAEVVIEGRKARRTNWSKRAEALRNTAASSTGIDQARALAAAAEEVLRFGKATGRKKSQGLVEANAESEFERAFDLAPSDETLARQLANVMDARRRLADRSRVLMRHAASIESPDGQRLANVRVAYAFMREGKHHEAVRAFREARSLESHDVHAIDRLATSSQIVEDFDGATEALEVLVGRPLPQAMLIGALAELVEVLAQKRGRLDLAEPVAHRLRDLAPMHPALSLVMSASSGERTEPIASEPSIASKEQSQGDSTSKTEQPRLTEPMPMKAVPMYVPEPSAPLDARELEALRAKLRKDPADAEARLRLKAHYRVHGPAAALVELLRYELGNASGNPERRRALEELCSVHRALARNDAALIGSLSQLVALDPLDADAARELAELLEKHGRWRDALVVLGRLAEAEVDGPKKLAATRLLAHRWTAQMPQAPQAAEAWEKVLGLSPADDEAFSALRELFIKRHAHGPLAALLEARAGLIVDAPARHAVLLDAAKLSAERLARPEVAIAHLRRVLAENPAHQAALEALERIADARRDYALLAEAMEGRLALVHDEGLKLTALQRLAALYAERLADPVRSLATWRRILDLVPSHTRAARAVRDALVATGDFDELERTYQATGDWDGFVATLVSGAEKEPDAGRKYALLERAAHVLAAKHPTGEAVVRLFERLLSLNPSRLDPARRLVAMHEAERRYGRLAGLYETLLEGATEPGERLEWLEKLVSLYAEKLPEPSKAWRFAVERFEAVSPAFEAIESLEAVARRFGKWADYAAALQGARSRAVQGDVALRARIATVQAKELGAVDDAVETLEALWADGHDVFRELEGLLRAHGRIDALRAAYARRVEALAPAEAIALLGQWALLEEEVFADVDRAIDVHRELVRRDASNSGSLRALLRFAEERGDELAASSWLKDLLALASDDERPRLRVRRARLLERRDGALFEAWSEVEAAIAEGVDDALVAPCLEAFAKHAELRALVLPVLAEVLDRLERWMDLAGVLGALAEVVSTREEHHGVMLRRAAVFADRLSDRVSACVLAKELVSESPSSEMCWDALRLYGEDAGTLGGEYAKAARATLEALSVTQLSAALRARLGSELAILLEDARSDEEAMRFWLLVVDADSSNDDARKHGIAFCKRPGCDVRVVDRFFRAAFGAEPSADALGQWGEALIAQGSWSEAADRLQARLVLAGPAHAAYRAIEECLENASDTARLVDVLAAHASTCAPSPSIDAELRLRRAELLASSLGDRERAIDEALTLAAAHPAHEGIEGFLETLAHEVPSRANDIWRALVASAEHGDRERLLAERLLMVAKVTGDRSEEEAALRRAQSLDAVAATPELLETILERLVRLVPGDADARSAWLEVLRPLGRTSVFLDAIDASYLASRSSETRAALRHAANVAVDVIDDVPRACAMLDRLRDDADAEPSLRVEVSSQSLVLRKKAGDPSAIKAALVLHLALAIDDVERGCALEELAQLGDRTGIDTAEAFDRWSDVAVARPDSIAALERLVALAESLGRWDRAADFLAQLAALARDADARMALSLRRASIVLDRLGDAAAALAIAKALPSEAPHRVALERLRAEAAERANDEEALGEALVALIDEENDRDARSMLRVRLARQLLRTNGDSSAVLNLAELALDDHAGNRDATALLQALLDRDDMRARAAAVLLERYGASEDDPMLLVAVLEASAATAVDDADAAAFLARAAEVSEEKLKDERRALSLRIAAFHRAPLAVCSAALAEFVRVARAQGAQAVIVDAIDLRLANAPDDVRSTVARAAVEVGEAMSIEPLHLLAWDDVLLQVDGPSRVRMDQRLAHARATSNAALVLEALARREDFLEHDSERFASERERLSALDSLDGRGEESIQCLFRGLALELDPTMLADLRQRLSTLRRSADLLHLEELVRAHTTLSSSDRVASLLLSARAASEWNQDHAGAVAWLEEAVSVDAADERISNAVRTLLGSEGPSGDDVAALARALERSARARGDGDALVAALELRRKGSPDEDLTILEALAEARQQRGDSAGELADLWVAILRLDPAHAGALVGLDGLADESAKLHAADALAQWLRMQSFDDDATAHLCERSARTFLAAERKGDALEFLLRAYRANPAARENQFSVLDELLEAHGELATRVELHRERTHLALDAGSRFERLLSLADLEEQLDGNAQRARATYEEALDVGEFDLGAVAALERVYASLRDWRALFDLLGRRLERSETSAEKSLIRVRLSAVALEHLDAPEDLIDMLCAWMRDEAPGHPARAAALELLLRLVSDERVRARIVDECEPLLVAADGAARSRVLEVAAEHEPTKADAAERWIALARHEHDAPSSDSLGRRALMRAFAGAPTSTELRTLMASFAASRSDWGVLARSLEETLREFEPWERHDAVLALVAILDEDAGDPRRALAVLEAAAAEPEADDSLHARAEELSMILSDWGAHVRALRRRAMATLEPELRLSCLRRAVTVAFEELANPALALSILDVVLSDGDDEPDLAQAVRFAREVGDGDSLRRYLPRLIDVRSWTGDEVEPDALELATLVTSSGGSIDDALEILHRALDAGAPRTRLSAMLLDVLRKGARHDELARELEGAAERAFDQAEAARHHDERSHVFEDALRDDDSAFQGAIAACEALPTEARYVRVASFALRESRFLDEAMRFLEAARGTLRDAALGSVYDLAVRVLDGEARVDAARRFAEFAWAAGRGAEAAGAWLVALEGAPENDPIANVLDERLTRFGSGFLEHYAAALGRIATDALDPTVAGEAALKRGILVLERLGRPLDAIADLRRADDAGIDAERTLGCLVMALEAAGPSSELAAAYARSVDYLQGTERGQRSAKLAKLRASLGADGSSVLDAAEDALELAPEVASDLEPLLERALLDDETFERAQAMLEAIYRGRGDRAARIDLRRKAVARAGDASSRIDALIALARGIDDLDGEPADILAATLDIAAIDAFNEEAFEVFAQTLKRKPDGSTSATHLLRAMAGENAEPVGLARFAFALATSAASGLEGTRLDLLRQASLAQPDQLPWLIALEEALRAGGPSRELVRVLIQRASIDPSASERLPSLRRALEIAKDSLRDVALAGEVLTAWSEIEESEEYFDERIGLAEAKGDVDDLLAWSARAAEECFDAAAQEQRWAAHCARAVGARRWADALRGYEQLLATDPSNAVTQGRQREAFIAAGDFDGLARALDDHAVAQDDDTRRAQLFLELAAVCIDNLRDDSRAKDALRRALDADAQAPLVLERAEAVAAASNDDVWLVEMLDSAADAACSANDTPRAVALLSKTATILDVRLADPSASLERLERARSLDPHDDAVSRELVRLARDLSRWELAIEVLEANVEREPSRTSLADLLSTAEASGESWLVDRALDAWRRFSIDAPELEDRLYDGLVREGRVDDAAEFLVERTERLRGAGRSSDARDAVARALDRAGATPPLTLLELAVRVDPENGAKLLELASRLVDDGRSDEARDVLEAGLGMLAAGETLAHVHLLLGSIARGQFDLDRARRHFVEAKKLLPASAVAHRELALVANESGDHDEAMNALKALLLLQLTEETEVRRSEALVLLARAYEDSGDMAKAGELYAHALAGDPSNEEAKRAVARR